MKDRTTRGRSPPDGQPEVWFADVVVTAVEEDVSLRSHTRKVTLKVTSSEQQTPRTSCYLLGDVGRRRGVQDGQQAAGVGSQLVVQAVLHCHGDGRDLITELVVVL